VLYAWNGAAFDGRTMYFTGGGHRAYGGNEVYAFDAHNLQWKVLNKPGRGLVRIDTDGDGKADRCRTTYTDGTPNPRHTYDGIVWAEDKVFIFGGVIYCTAMHSGAEAIWAFDPVRGQYDQLRGVKPLPNSHVQIKTAFDPETGCIFVLTRKDIGCFRSGTWTHRWRLKRGVSEATMDVAPDRRLLVAVSDTRAGIQIWRIQDDGRLGPIVRQRLAIPKWAKQAGLAYDSKRRVFALWRGGPEIVVIDPDDWSVETHNNKDGKGPAVPDVFRSRVYSKWAYIADYDVFMGYNDHRHGVWFYRLADR